MNGVPDFPWYKQPQPFGEWPKQWPACPPPTEPDCPPNNCQPPCPPPPPSPCKNPPGVQPWRLGQVPPVPSVIEGESLYEAMNIQTQRVNACINQWNSIAANCFATMNQAVEAARSNGVYYDSDEVKYTNGYDEEEACAYALVIKKAVDKCGRPIFIRLAPAFDNSTNSGIKQDIYDVSYIKSANVIMTAVPPSQTKWYGPSMWQGAPIPGDDPNQTDRRSVNEMAENGNNEPTSAIPYWVYGFSRAGQLKVFDGLTVTPLILQQNGMVDVIGGCIPLIFKGEITPEANEQTDKLALGAIGFRPSDGAVFFLSVSGKDQPGMTGQGAAKILQGYGCKTAVMTYGIPVASQNESGGLLYMAQMTTIPQGGLVPENLAYWYISKQPDFKNDFQHEVADLVQITGQNSWRIYLSRFELEAISDRVTENHEDILAEIERASKAEQALQQDINDEVTRATEAEKNLQTNIDSEVNRAEEAEKLLQENINAEVNRATQAEQTLQENIDKEQARAETAEKTLQNNIDAETARAESAEQTLTNDLNAEIERATQRENDIQKALDQEITTRINADNDLINAINEETLARKAADTALSNQIDAVEASLSGDITKEVNRAKAAEQELQDDIQKIENDINSLTDQVTEAVDKVNDMSSTVTNLQTVVNNITSGTQDLPYLPLAGGTLTGNVNMTGATTLTVGRGPTENMEVATKKYVDDAVAGGTSPGGDVSKEYVDQQISSLQEQITQSTGDISTVEKELTDVKSDIKTNTTNITQNTTNITEIKQDIESLQADVDGKVSKAGDTMTGPLTLSGEPTEDSQAATKKYVDDAVSSGGNYLPLAGGQMDEDAVISSPNELKFQAPTGVQFSDGTGSGTNMYGMATINNAAPSPGEPDAIAIDNTGVKVFGPLSILNGAKQALGKLLTGLIDIAGIILQPHNSGASGATHLDINVPSDEGAVYINRSTQGTDGTWTAVDGGTGEIHLTEVHAPNELRLNPGTNINVMQHLIKNVIAIQQSSDRYGVSIWGSTGGENAGGIALNTVNLFKDSTFMGNIKAALNQVIFSNMRLSGLANGIEDTDAATVGQILNAPSVISAGGGYAFKKIAEAEGMMYRSSTGNQPELILNIPTNTKYVAITAKGFTSRRTDITYIESAQMSALLDETSITSGSFYMLQAAGSQVSTQGQISFSISVPDKRVVVHLGTGGTTAFIKVTAYA